MATKNSSSFSLTIIRNQLNVDRKMFDDKLMDVRHQLFQYLERSINTLLEMKRRYERDFEYLKEEHENTCLGNEFQYEQLLNKINCAEKDSELLSREFERFQRTFPMRPTMLKDIPEFDLQEIPFERYVKRRSHSLSGLPPNPNHTDHLSSVKDSSTQTDGECSDQSTQCSNIRRNSFQSIPDASASNAYSFAPIQRSPEETSSVHPKFTDQSMDNLHASHKHLSSFQGDSEEGRCQSSLRTVSSRSTTSNYHSTLKILFKIPHHHSAKKFFIAHHNTDNALLVYSMESRSLEYLFIAEGHIDLIHHQIGDTLLTLGYSSIKRCFYYLPKTNARLIFFRINDNSVDTIQSMDLVDDKHQRIENLLTGHVEGTHFYFFNRNLSNYLQFGSFDIEQRQLISTIPMRTISHDNQEHRAFSVIDFAINRCYLGLLVQLRNTNTYFLSVHDHQMNQIHSFDLLDAKQPWSVVSMIRDRTPQVPSTTTEQSDGRENEFVLLINDPRNHIIHCCNGERYLTTIEINAFGISPLDDGNIAVVANKDIRGLRIRDYL